MAEKGGADVLEKGALSELLSLLTSRETDVVSSHTHTRNQTYGGASFPGVYSRDVFAK